MDRFGFFFGFYGLLLGLGVAELLGGFARYVRLRPARSLEPQTALLAVLTFVVICATWIDAWGTLQKAQLNFAGLWAPIAIGSTYYLAAAMVFPHDAAQLENLAAHFQRRKRFIVLMLLLAEVFVTFTFLDTFATALRERPATVWFYHLPYNILIKGAWVALLLMRGRRAGMALMVLLIALFLVPYWDLGAYAEWLHRTFD